MTLVALGILAGIAGGATLAAIAGARRTSSAYERHAVAVDAPHAWINPDFDPALWIPGVLDPAFAIDGVETYSELATLAMRPTGTDFFFLFGPTVAAPVDDRYGVEVNRFRVVEGRVYDHRREDEVLLTEQYAELAGLEEGDVVSFESWTKGAVARAFENNFDVGEPDGPVVELTVVGIVREVRELNSNMDVAGSAYLTSAFTRRWRSEIGEGFPMGAVRLTRGYDGFPDYRDSIFERGEQSGISMFAGQPGPDEAYGAIDAQVLALLVLAAVMGAAGAAVVFAALARQLSFAAGDQQALRAIGMTRNERAAAIAMLGVPPGFVAAVAAAGLAWAASALLPRGSPGRIEPDPGIRADPLVLAVGAGVVAAIVVGLAGIAALTVTRAVSSRSGPGLASRPGVGVSIARWFSASAPGSIGVRHALDRGRGDRAVPARSTLIGCTFGVMGIAAALVFAASLRNLVSSPRLFGVPADFYVSAYGTPEEWQALADSLEADRDIDELATVVSTNLIVNGESVGGVVADLRRGDPLSAIVSGRAVQARDEMTIGVNVAAILGVGVGDTVSVSLADGSFAPYEVVGIAALPNGMGKYTEMAAVLGDSADRFLTYDEGPWLGVALGFADGVDPLAKMDELVARDDIDVGTTLDTPPLAVANLGEVEEYPEMLAMVLAVLAAAFLLHALSVGTRRRAVDLAVLKALGFSRRQLRTVVLSQATTIAAVSLVIGVPLGVGIGRLAWASSIDELGVLTEYRLPVWWMVGVVAALLVANLLALVAARGIMRMKPAVELGAGRLA